MGTRRRLRKTVRLQIWAQHRHDRPKPGDYWLDDGTWDEVSYKRDFAIWVERTRRIIEQHR